MRWFLPVLFGVITSLVHASTITDPGVIITLQGGNATMTWNSTITGPAIVEHSPDLANWSPLSQNNTAGLFWHAVGGATKGFYRLKWTPSSPQTADMITVQGGMLPQSSELAGQQVTTFQIGKYEVTWQVWLDVRNWAVANGYSDLENIGKGIRVIEGIEFGGPSGPVHTVNWYDIFKWCNARSEMEGLTPVYYTNGAPFKAGQELPTIKTTANGYRLPTEVEWEWAARGGVSSQGYTYSGSNDVNSVAVHFGNSGPDKWKAARSVGGKAANELGLYDMSGNVYERTFDVNSSLQRSRGGYWGNNAIFCTVTYRDGGSTSLVGRSDSHGFRLARNAP